MNLGEPSRKTGGINKPFTARLQISLHAGHTVTTMSAVAIDLRRTAGYIVADRQGRLVGKVECPMYGTLPDVPDALTEARERGWRLFALSNTDRDFIEASMAAIGVPFAGAIVASEIGSYKPAHGHWHAFYEQTGADRSCHVHVAQSHFHDIVAAHELGIPSIWINRLGESAGPAPTREQPTLAGLADTLDELVAPR